VRHRLKHVGAHHCVLVDLDKVVVALLRSRMQYAVDLILERQYGVDEHCFLRRGQIPMIVAGVHLGHSNLFRSRRATAKYDRRELY